MIKKFLAIFMTAAMLSLLAGCGDSEATRSGIIGGDSSRDKERTEDSVGGTWGNNQTNQNDSTGGDTTGDTGSNSNQDEGDNTNTTNTDGDTSVGSDNSESNEVQVEDQQDQEADNTPEAGVEEALNAYLAMDTENMWGQYVLFDLDAPSIPFLVNCDTEGGIYHYDNGEVVCLINGWIDGVGVNRSSNIIYTYRGGSDWGNYSLYEYRNGSFQAIKEFEYEPTIYDEQYNSIGFEYRDSDGIEYDDWDEVETLIKTEYQCEYVSTMFNGNFLNNIEDAVAAYQSQY